MQYLYLDGDHYHFMDNKNYEQTFVTAEQMGEAKNFIKENTTTHILFYNGKAIGVTLPNAMDLKVVKCDPGVRGDTVSGATKPATLETGYVVNVPALHQRGRHAPHRHPHGRVPDPRGGLSSAARLPGTPPNRESSDGHATPSSLPSAPPPGRGPRAGSRSTTSSSWSSWSRGATSPTSPGSAAARRWSSARGAGGGAAPPRRRPPRPPAGGRRAALAPRRRAGRAGGARRGSPTQPGRGGELALRRHLLPLALARRAAVRRRRPQGRRRARRSASSRR